MSKQSNKKVNKPNVKATEDKRASEAKKAAEREKKRALKAEKQRLREKRIKERNELREERLKKRREFYGRIKKKLQNRSEGFDYENNGIFPRVELTVRGDRATVADRLSDSGITITDMRPDGDKTRLKIRKKDLRKAIAILDDMCYNYQISATYGAGRRLAFWLSRAGLIVGAAASVACLNISYGYIWRVDISGNDKLSAAAIESVLSGAGVHIGSKKSEELVDRVTSALENMDGVADAACEITGTTLNVRVLEAEDFTEQQKSAGYASRYDAVVTRIVMRSGTALVNRGAVVKPGDVLARGEVFSTTGELLYVAPCDAEVYGNVSVTFSAEIPKTAVEYRRTGKSETKTVFELFGFKMGSARSPYSSYETQAHTANYDVLIPLHVTTYDFYEIEPVEFERDLDEAAREYALQKIEQMRFEGDFEYSYNITPLTAGLYSVHVFLSGEALISTGIDQSMLPPLPEKQP